MTMRSGLEFQEVRNKGTVAPTLIIIIAAIAKSFPCLKACAKHFIGFFSHYALFTGGELEPRGYTVSDGKVRI